MVRMENNWSTVIVDDLDQKEFRSMFSIFTSLGFLENPPLPPDRGSLKPSDLKWRNWKNKKRLLTNNKSSCDHSAPVRCPSILTIFDVRCQKKPVRAPEPPKKIISKQNAY